MMGFWDRLDEEMSKDDPEWHAITILDNIVNNGLTVDSALIIAERKHGEEGVKALTEIIEEWNNKILG